MPIEIGSAYGKIIIDSSGVTRGVTQANKNLSSFQDSVKTLAAGVAKGMGIITAEVALFKKIFEFGEEGAKIQQMEQSFGTLLDTIGAQPDLLKQLQKASRDTIDDYSLMSSTALLLAGAQGELGTALANATPELLEMAKAAQKLNPQLGDVTFLYDSLARGIKRGSPMILDNLGIIVKLEEANEKYAESLGKAADELSAEEQKIALLNEVLKQGDVLMRQVGGNADSATDSFDRMQAAVKNVTDDFKKSTVEGLKPWADTLYWILTFQQQVDEALAENNRSLVYSTDSYEDYVRELIKNAAATRDIEKSTLALAEKRIREGQGVSALAVDYGGLGKATYTALREAKKFGDYTDGPLRSAIAKTERDARELAEAAKFLDKEYGGLSEESQDVLRQALKLGDYMGGPLLGVTEKTAKNMRELTDAEDEQRLATERLEEAQEQLQQAMTDLQLFVSGPIREENEQFIEDQEEIAEKIDKLKVKIGELESKSGNLTKAEKQDLADAKAAVDELTGAYGDNAKAHELRTKQILFDLLAERVAMNGLTEDETHLLTTLAVQWGLMDAATAETVGKMDEALLALANGEGLNAAIGKMNVLAGNVLALSGDYDINFNITTTGNVPGGPAGANWQPIPLAEGGSFVVPPGYPNDSYMAPLALTSGEEVEVTPVGGHKAGGKNGGATYIYLTAQYQYESETSLMDQVRMLQALEA